MSKKNWKKVIEIVVVLLTAISGFLSGQATAKNGSINLFNNQKIERSLI